MTATTANVEQKTMTINQLIVAVKNAPIQQDYEDRGMEIRDSQHDNIDGDSDYIATGLVYNEIDVPGIGVLTYQKTFEYDSNDVSSLVVRGHDTTEISQWQNAGGSESLNPDSMDVVDDDGDTLNLWEVGEIIEKYTKIESFDFSFLEQIDSD